MRVLNWPGPKIDKKRSPTYEWAYIKTHLEGASNERSYKTYQDVFSKEPKKGVPYWLVRLAIYYAALHIGYTRAGKKMNSSDERMLSCIASLDEKALRNNKILWHHMYLHDVEPAIFGGRELVS